MVVVVEMNASEGRIAEEVFVHYHKIAERNSSWQHVNSIQEAIGTAKLCQKGRKTRHFIVTLFSICPPVKLFLCIQQYINIVYPTQKELVFHFTTGISLRK